jgi:hypothetical protein
MKTREELLRLIAFFKKELKKEETIYLRSTYNQLLKALKKVGSRDRY